MLTNDFDDDLHMITGSVFDTLSICGLYINFKSDDGTCTTGISTRLATFMGFSVNTASGLWISGS